MKNGGVVVANEEIGYNGEIVQGCMTTCVDEDR